MAVLAINYDLKAPGRNYQPLYDAIKSYNYCKILDSCWLIDTANSTSSVRDHLKGCVDGNDEIFVVQLRQNWATSFTDSATDWLKSPSRSW